MRKLQDSKSHEVFVKNICSWNSEKDEFEGRRSNEIRKSAGDNEVILGLKTLLEEQLSKRKFCCNNKSWSKKSGVSSSNKSRIIKEKSKTNCRVTYEFDKMC